MKSPYYFTLSLDETVVAVLNAVTQPDTQEIEKLLIKAVSNERESASDDIVIYNIKNVDQYEYKGFEGHLTLTDHPDDTIFFSIVPVTCYSTENK